MDSTNREYTTQEIAVIELFDKISKEKLSIKLSNNGSIDTCQYSSILNDCNISNDLFNKDGLLNHTLWYKYLLNVSEYLNISQYKYQTIESFLKAYPSKYDDLDIVDVECLRKTANLMVILLSMVTPRKNKGLAMTVVPKVIEGINTKYVTGSGQTKATADRVHIFETEGGISAFRRGGRTKSSSKYKRQDNDDKVESSSSSSSSSSSLPPFKKSNNSHQQSLSSSSSRDQQNSPVQKFLLIDQPFELNSTYSLLDNCSSFDSIDDKKDTRYHHSYDKNTHIFNSFVSGYNDEDMFECFTTVKEVPKANYKNVETQSTINIQTNSDQPVSEEKQREQFASIMRSHDKLSKLFTWGPSALLQQQPIGERSSSSKARNDTTTITVTNSLVQR